MSPAKCQPFCLSLIVSIHWSQQTRSPPKKIPCNICQSLGIKNQPLPWWSTSASVVMFGKVFSLRQQLVVAVTWTLKWCHNGNDSVSNHQPHDCLLNHLFSRRSKKTSKLRVTGLCAGNSPVTGEFPAQMASNAENVSIWWRHHEQC